ncbi:MAG: hypothetical protein R3B09_14740 [Nannocystaceae bacterium]
MTPGLHALPLIRACEGLHLVVGGHPEGDPDLALASLVGEAESAGVQVVVVTLRMGSHDDAEWIAAGLRWLHAHGRRPLLRTAVVLPRSLAALAWETRATVVLELAHHRPELQRALVGPEADPAATLLLQAQHLAQLGVPTMVHLGPLLPTIHDQRQHLEPLLHHIRAAELRDLHLSVGRLSPGREQALRATLSEGAMHALRRAYGGEDGARERLSRLGHVALIEGVRSVAHELGIRVDACGCAAACHLDGGGRPAHVPVIEGELFSEAAG